MDQMPRLSGKQLLTGRFDEVSADAASPVQARRHAQFGGGGRVGRRVVDQGALVRLDAERGAHQREHCRVGFATPSSALENTTSTDAVSPSASRCSANREVAFVRTSKSRGTRTRAGMVGLTHHNTNRPMVVDGPAISIRPVGERQVSGTMR